VVVVTDDNVSRINLNVPAELKERLKQGDDSQTNQVVEALEIYFGEEQTGNRAAIERQIQRYEEQKARGRRMVQDGEDMVKEAEAGISRLKSRLETLEASTASYVEDMDELLDEMNENRTTVWETHPSVERIAREHGEPADDVLKDLKERSDLHESFFSMGAPEVEEEKIDTSDYEFNLP
jgi:chromosome segregation ATPase